MDLTKHVNTEVTEPIPTTKVSWKERIVQYLLDVPEHAATKKELLEKTDPSYDESNLDKRLHCLESQLFYAKRDLKAALIKEDDKVVLKGVYANDDRTEIYPLK